MDHKKLIFIVILAIFALITALFIRYQTLGSLELSTLDLRFQLRDVQPVDDSPIVLVTIDDYSFSALPDRWPWPRSYYAHAIRNLKKAGARVVGVDVIFDKPDNYGLEKDSLLAAAIRDAGNVVLARKLDQDERIKTYQTMTDPIPLLANEARSGLVSIPADPDGIYRRYLPAQYFDNAFRPSFVVELIRKYHGIADDVTPEFEETHFRFGDLHIPAYENTSMLINYAGPAGTFPQYSFVHLVDDDSLVLADSLDENTFSEHLLPDEVFKDKIVIIGSTASELHDDFPTPFLGSGADALETAGAEVLANATRTILNDNYYHRLPFGTTLAIVLILYILVILIAYRYSALMSIMFTMATVAVYILVQFILFARANIVMEMVFPVTTLFGGFVAISLYQYVLTRREKQRILGAFQHYVPAKVVAELIKHPEKLTLGGEERFMTVLFSDVANFTSISEAMDTTALVKLINEYLSEMTDIILKYDGIIDKYEGDAIMAEFGAPIFYEEHALNACLAALDMQTRLKELSRNWRRQGRPVLTCRTGINSGNMAVGNMGSKAVFDYTVLGDEVNLASRLEGANKVYGTRNMISEATYKLVESEMITRPLDLIVVKGKRKPVKCFELIARKSEKLHDLKARVLPLYMDGISYYEDRQWEKAIGYFRNALQLMPDDGPSKVYLLRSEEFLKKPPPEDWDGVYQMQSK